MEFKNWLKLLNRQMGQFLQLFILVVFFLACDFGDTNINPVRTTEAEIKEILPVALAQSARNIASIGGRVTGTVIQHFEGIDAQPQSYSQYLIDERTLDELWKNGLYAGAMKDCQIIIEKADEGQLPIYKGIAKILMAFNLGIATSYWGDVPFSKAFRASEIQQPAYDPQSIIYQQIIQLLEEAIFELQKDLDGAIVEDDLIYKGSPASWIGTAYALQARYYLQMSNKRPEGVEQALESIRRGAFTSTEEQPDFPFGNNLNESNPFNSYNIERPGQLAIGTFLLSVLQQKEDPRLAVLAVEADGRFLAHQSTNTDLYWARSDSPLPLISFSELKFIEAECLLRTNQLGSAEKAFKEAVARNFIQLGITKEDYQRFNSAYIHFEGLSDLESRLEHLLTQKYIALYVQGSNEVWADYRRTGYPKLRPPNNANNSFNPSLIIPRRYLYPVSERNTNLKEMNNAIEHQGGHLMDVDIWAFER